MTNKFLVELYSNMPTNSIENARMAGESFVVRNGKDMIFLMDILLDNGVQFCITELGDCLIDYSYEYKFEGKND